MAAVIPLPYLFGSYQIRVGEQTGSPSLMADGMQHKADVLTPSQVFLAMIAQSPDVILCKESLAGKGPGYAFAEAGVETAPTQAKTLVELVTDLREAKGGNAADCY